MSFPVHPCKKSPPGVSQTSGGLFRSPQISTTQIFLPGAVCRTIAQAGPVFHFLSFFTHFSAIFSLDRQNRTPASPWSPIRPSPPCSTGGPSGRCWNTAPSTASTPPATARRPPAEPGAWSFSSKPPVSTGHIPSTLRITRPERDWHPQPAAKAV